MNEKSIGAIMSVFGVAEVLGGLFLGKFSDIFGRKLTVLIGILCYLIGLILSWLAKDEPMRLEYMFYLAAACFGMGIFLLIFRYFC